MIIKIETTSDISTQQLIADDGVGNWSSKAKILSDDTSKKAQVSDTQGVHGSEVAKMWTRIKPIVKIQLSKDETRECGHSCSTCPTRKTCQLHDAVDIEDM